MRAVTPPRPLGPRQPMPPAPSRAPAPHGRESHASRAGMSHADGSPIGRTPHASRAVMGSARPIYRITCSHDQQSWIMTTRYPMLPTHGERAREREPRAAARLRAVAMCCLLWSSPTALSPQSTPLSSRGGGGRMSPLRGIPRPPAGSSSGSARLTPSAPPVGGRGPTLYGTVRYGSPIGYGTVRYSPTIL